jgi:hypothetical protein
MDAVADFASIPVDSWPFLLDRIEESGISIDERMEERGLLWCTCRRDGTSLGLGFDPSKLDENLCIYTRMVHCWWRPIATRRLFRDVRSSVQFVTGV